MAYTNFIGDGVSVNGAPLIPGGGTIPVAPQYFYVSSVRGSNGNEGGMDNPFATIDYAVGKCTAGYAGVIVVLAGHVETVTAAGGLALDVAGITIVGLGNGRGRPQINFTTAVGASMTVTAANITVKNVWFSGGFDALTNPIHVQAAGFSLLDCEYVDVTGQCTDCVLTTAAANRMMISGLRYTGASAAGTNAGIAIVGGDGIVIDGLVIDGNFAVGAIDIRTTATTNIEVRTVVARTRNAADVIMVDTITASTGTVGPNIYMTLADNAANFANSIQGATFVYHNPVSIVNLAGEQGGINFTAVAGFKTQSTNA